MAIWTQIDGPMLTSRGQLMIPESSEIRRYSFLDRFKQPLWYEQFFDPNQPRVRPTWTRATRLDPDLELDVEPFLQRFERDIREIRADPRALAALRERALASGLSPWAAMQLQQQALEEQQARENLAQQAAAAAAQARSQLAMRGGLTAGAAERLAQQEARQRMESAQNLARQAQMQRLGILSEDERNRLQTLMQLPSMELQAIQPEFQRQELALRGEQLRADARRFNIAQALEEAHRRRMAEEEAWRTRLQAAASERAAQAQERAAEGTWICSAIGQVTTYSDDDRLQLSKFRAYAFKNYPQYFTWYMRHGKELVQRAEKKKINWKDYEYISRITIQYVHEGEFEQAMRFYAKQVFKLMDKYWPKHKDKQYQAAKEQFYYANSYMGSRTRTRRTRRSEAFFV